MYLVTTKVGHPELKAWKYPLPGDDVVTTIQRVVIDVADPHVVRLKMPPDQHRSTLCDDVACRGGEWSDVQWSVRFGNIAFVSTSRDHKREDLRIADAATGEIRDVLEETVPTFYESGNGRVNWKYLPASNELIWFSETIQLGASVSVRLAHRPAEESDHVAATERHAAYPRGREESRAVLSWRRPGEGRSVFRSPLSHRIRRKESGAADAGGRQSRRDAFAIGTLFCR